MESQESTSSSTLDKQQFSSLKNPLTDKEFEKLKKQIQLAFEAAPLLLPSFDGNKRSITDAQYDELFPYLCRNCNPFSSKQDYLCHQINIAIIPYIEDLSGSEIISS